MTDGAKRSVALVAPYAAWMELMVTLPATAWAYAVRGAVTAALLIAAVLYVVITLLACRKAEYRFERIDL